MKRAVLVTAAILSIGVSQAWANCEKIAYVESVRTYAGVDVNNHIFVRETGVDSPLFVANTRNANIVRGALWAHVHRTPVKIITVSPLCPLPSAGLWTNISTVTNLILAP